MNKKIRAALALAICLRKFGATHARESTVGLRIDIRHSVRQFGGGSTRRHRYCDG